MAYPGFACFFELGERPGDALKVLKLSPNATIPTRGTKYSAGLDLYASVSISIPSYSFALVSTSIAIELPQGTYGRIASRSSLALKGIEVGAGVIDSDYRGEVKVLLRNFGESAFSIAPGDRIAQLIVTPYCLLRPTETETLASSVRNTGGFGSTDT